LSWDIWVEVCRFFRFDPDFEHPTPDTPGADYIVPLPAPFARKLIRTQAHAVWYALHQFCNPVIRSSMLGHGMGIGKTTIIYTIIFVQHTINQMWAEIKTTPAAHTPSSPGNTICCPSNDDMRDRFGFHCPCHPASPSNFVKERLGANMVISPLSLLDTHIAEFAKYFPTDDRPFELLRAHNTRTVPITEEQWKSLWGKETRYYKDNPDYEGQGRIHISSKWSPRLKNAHIIILTTSDSGEKQFLDQVLNKYTITDIITILPSRAPPKKGQEQLDADKNPKMVKHITKLTKRSIGQRVVFSTIFKDEFHSRPAQYLALLKRILNNQFKGISEGLGDRGAKTWHPVALCLLSRIFLTKGPSDIRLFIDLIQLKNWEHDPVLVNWMGNKLADLSKQ
jgi:hypothetical protein